MQDGTTAVSYAAQYGHSNVVNLLINTNADINLADKVTYIVMLQLLTLYNNYCLVNKHSIWIALFLHCKNARLF